MPANLQSEHIFMCGMTWNECIVVSMVSYTIFVAFNHTLHHEAAIWQYGTFDVLLFQGKDQQTNLSPGLDHRPNPSLNCSFNEHYNDASLSDVILKAGDCQVHAHKIVLAVQSPLFKAMFQVQLLALITCYAISALLYLSICLFRHDGDGGHDTFSMLSVFH